MRVLSAELGKKKRKVKLLFVSNPGEEEVIQFFAPYLSEGFV